MNYSSEVKGADWAVSCSKPAEMGRTVLLLVSLYLCHEMQERRVCLLREIIHQPKSKGKSLKPIRAE